MLENQLKERLYFIGDVHARHSKLIDLLDAIDFDITKLNSSANARQLVFIGDLIDSVPNCDGDHLALLNRR